MVTLLWCRWRRSCWTASRPRCRTSLLGPWSLQRPTLPWQMGRCSCRSWRWRWAGQGRWQWQLQLWRRGEGRKAPWGSAACGWRRSSAPGRQTSWTCCALPGPSGSLLTDGLPSSTQMMRDRRRALLAAPWPWWMRCPHGSLAPSSPSRWHRGAQGALPASPWPSASPSLEWAPSSLPRGEGSLHGRWCSGLQLWVIRCPTTARTSHLCVDGVTTFVGSSIA
mmetsp:Transcript_47598/g.103490  ORF Transcript_47598/g.103490 Transcript_47598/m.103490 type:complete len:222 (-) Transcript_47598:1340-2005(-)